MMEGMAMGLEGVRQAIAFGTLLRRYRLAAGLSQEALAERASMSARGVSDLERGLRRAPRRDTVVLLARALGLRAEERAELEATVVRRRLLPAIEKTSPNSTLPVPTTSLPTTLTRLVGRAGDVTAVTALLARPEVRLLTLTGVGGVGKTRLAIAVAKNLSGHYADGVAFVPLAALNDPDLVLPTVAGMLGLRPSGQSSPSQQLREYLGHKNMLLVLDNLEHLLSAAPSLTEVLGMCPGVHVLATSRARLHVRGEHRYDVPPLALPDQSTLSDASALGEVAAIALFVERAREGDPTFVFGSDNAAAVGALCRHLDGLPLALELAAPRLALFSPAMLLARIERRLGVLTGGGSDLPERQQTLRATLAWSYDLLHAGEQALFRQLSVFAGEATLDAVVAVCAGIDGALDEDMLDWLGSLLDKSLLTRVAMDGDEPRFRMLETLREYGLEQLEASGAAECVRARHAAYYLTLAEEAEPRLREADQGAAFALLEREADNLRAALGWLAGPTGNGEMALRLAVALSWFWFVRSQYAEGLRWLDAALRVGRSAPLLARAWALYHVCSLATGASDYGRGLTAGEEALALGRLSGDLRVIAHITGPLGATLMQTDAPRAVLLWEEGVVRAREIGDRWIVIPLLVLLGMIELAPHRANALVEEALSLARAIGDRWALAWSLIQLGEAAFGRADYDRAAALWEEALVPVRELGSKRELAFCLQRLGRAEQERGDDERAAVHLEKALVIAQDTGERGVIVPALLCLGYCAATRRAGAEAQQLYAEAMVLSRTMGNARYVASCLMHLAALLDAGGQSWRAARLLGASEAGYTTGGYLLEFIDRGDRARTVAAVRAALGEEAFAAARAEGRALTPEQAAAEALGPSSA